MMNLACSYDGMRRGAGVYPFLVAIFVPVVFLALTTQSRSYLLCLTRPSQAAARFTARHYLSPNVLAKSTGRRGLNTCMMASDLFENIDGIIFDCDGVLAETERDGHRVSFNRAFKEKGLRNEWSVEEYGIRLKTGGGKERMTKYFNEVGWPDAVGQDRTAQAAFVKELHKLKTDLFTKLVEKGEVPLRPNVEMLMNEALANGLKVAVCSTSNEVAVKNILTKNLGEDILKSVSVFAGDIVEKKKPAPDVYLLAAKVLELDPRRVWVVEDSEIGLTAAKAANMNCIVTKSYYTNEENFDKADVVVNDLSKGLDGPINLTYLNYKSKIINKNNSNKDKDGMRSDNADMFASNEKNIAQMFKKMAKGEIKGMPF